MRYQRVFWRQSSPEFPTVLYSEIDDEGWEVRKVEEYANGRRDLASSDIETGQTFLGEMRIPSLDEINSQAEFEGAEISADEFEKVWDDARKWFEM